VDRCALFVDAGYVLADGAMAVHGTRRRESVSWDYAGLLQLFGNLAMERTRLPLLRCYWYEATVEGRRSVDHDALADLPGVKLRVAKKRPGRREGVESEIHRDLTTLARNKAVSDVMVVSAEEDLVQVIADVQDMGMRVTLLNIAVDGEDGDGTISRALRQECDDVVEISAAHLRPYVELISGAEPPRRDESDSGTLAPGPVMNGNGHRASSGNGPVSLPGRAAPYAQPQAGPETSQQAPVPARLSVTAAEYQQPSEVPPAAAVVSAESSRLDRGQPERADAVVTTDYPPLADFSANVDYTASVDYGAPADYAPVGDHPTAIDQGPAFDYRSALDYGAAMDFGPVPDYAMPLSAPTLTPREERPRPAAELSPYNPGAGSAQVRRLHTRGAVPGGQNPGQSPLGLPSAAGPVPGAPAPTQPAGPQPGPHQMGGQLPGGQQPGGQLASGQPTGAQPALPVAPVVPLESNGAGGYAAARGTSHGGPRQVIPGAGGPVSSQTPPLGPPVPGGPVAPGAQAGQPGQQDIGGPSGPMGLVGPGGYSPGTPGVSLADAVQSAHEEGQSFGESVARDAPALWLEAVVARKPRMPSDLEARLLQGSTLPIDFLLHDEVRHALRRGFWDALERARR